MAKVIIEIERGDILRFPTREPRDANNGTHVYGIALSPDRGCFIFGPGGRTRYRREMMEIPSSATVVDQDGFWRGVPFEVRFALETAQQVLGL